MNILVTGAYGFIGRQVVAGLLQAGHSVVCGVRKPEPNVFADLDAVVCDFAHDTQPELEGAYVGVVERAEQNHHCRCQRSR